jgi:acyl carrier protein
MLSVRLERCADTLGMYNTHSVAEKRARSHLRRPRSMPDELAEKVLETIATSKRIARERVLLDSTLEDLGMDSLDQLNLLFALESDFNISIPDDEAKSIRTVREMVEGVRKLVAGASGPAAASVA